jgi:hypothetical protein
MTRKGRIAFGAITCGLVASVIALGLVGFGSGSHSKASSSPTSRFRGHGGKHWHNPYTGPWPGISGALHLKDDTVTLNP